eukprot:2020438-Amphidinium_carterae.1
MSLEFCPMKGWHSDVVKPRLCFGQNGNGELTWRQSACTSNMADTACEQEHCAKEACAGTPRGTAIE